MKKINRNRMGLMIPINYLEFEIVYWYD